MRRTPARSRRHSYTGRSAAPGKAPASISVIAAGLPAPEIEGERKTVTALFADIKGSTELMEDLDPEEARALSIRR